MQRGLAIAMVTERPGSVAALSEQLDRLGHDVRMYVQPDGVEQVEWRRLADEWQSRRPDIVHSHLWRSGMAALAGARELDVPVVHTSDPLARVRRGRRVRLARAVARTADRVVAPCADEVGGLVRVGVDRRRLQVVPVGVDADQFSPGGSRHDPPRVLSAGRLAERSGHDTVIRALQAVPKAELVVVGGPDPGELSEDPEYRRLWAVAERVGVLDRVHWLGGVDDERFADLIRSATAVACTPWYEPSGLVALQAMACATPVVATAVGGLRDVIVDGATGLHVPPRRPDRLAQALRSLLEDPFRCDGFGVAGRDRVLSRYTWDQVGRDLSAVYDGVRESPGPRR